jgi:hypothetical protein
VARVYESMSSRAAKHAGTLIVLPVANRAFAHCRSNHEDWLPRALWHESSFKPTAGVFHWHNLPQEAPQAFAQAMVDVDGY